MCMEMQFGEGLMGNIAYDVREAWIAASERHTQASIPWKERAALGKFL